MVIHSMLAYAQTLLMLRRSKGKASVRLVAPQLAKDFDQRSVDVLSNDDRRHDFESKLFLK